MNTTATPSTHRLAETQPPVPTSPFELPAHQQTEYWRVLFLMQEGYMLHIKPGRAYLERGGSSPRYVSRAVADALVLCPGVLETCAQGTVSDLRFRVRQHRP